MRLARRMENLAPSSVREILKVAERPDILSFAGGLPAAELFPVAAIAEAQQQVMNESAARALQYGVTEGLEPLRAWIAKRLGDRGVRSSVEQLLITAGSQQGIDLVGRALLDPGDVVVTENPSYLAALQAFASLEARVVCVGSDDDGMRTGELEAVFARDKPRLIYLCADFQNPTGRTLSYARRLELIAIARRHDVPILEDDPYGELRFRGTSPPAIAALDDGAHVIRLGTFSKTLAPGLRIGWVHGPVEIVQKLAILKQACDLHTATLAQWVALRVLGNFDYDEHLARLRAVYGARRDAMLAALKTTMPAGTSWTEPEGGLFVWLRLPDGVRDRDVFHAALARGVAVVPGSGFFVGAPEHGYLRLNFSNQPPEAIAVGMQRLAEAIRGGDARSTTPTGTLTPPQGTAVVGRARVTTR